MAPRIYDAIVIGTGAGGSTAMKILCEAGLQVCALNSGPRINPETDYRGHRQVYDLKYRGYGDPLRFKDKPHQEPYSVEESEYSRLVLEAMQGNRRQGQFLGTLFSTLRGHRF